MNIEQNQLAVRLSGESYVVSLSSDPDYFAENWRAWESGLREHVLFDFVCAEARNGGVFIDVGAWIGAVTLLAARKFEQVYAFEADPVSLADLRENVNLNRLDNVIVVPHFVADRVGKQKLFSMDSGNNSGSSMFHDDGKSSWNVEAVRLDEFINENVPSSRNVIVKIDIEGAEYLIMPTLAGLIGAGRIKGMCLSLHPFLLAKKYRGTTFRRKVVRRAMLAWNTWRVLRIVRNFKRVLNANGEPVSLMAVWLDILLRGRQKADNSELYFFQHSSI